MTVYVESNFVLEITLGQEQASAAEAILERAESREVALAIPWSALAEPFANTMKRSQDRNSLVNLMNRQLSDLRRSQKLEGAAQDMETALNRLAPINREVTDNLLQTTERILDVATVLSINGAVFRQAMAYRTLHGLSPQDAMVYASVVGDLVSDGSSGPHHFVTRDLDFQVKDIENELRANNCELLSSFTEMAVLLERPLTD